MLRSANSTDRSLRRVLPLVAALALVVAGCGTSGDIDAVPTTAKAAPASTTIASTTTTDADPPASTETDWCPSTDEVAEVVGHEVTQSATAGGGGSVDLSYSFEGCSYDGDGNDYSITRATVETEEDGSPFDLLGQDAEAALADKGFTPVEDLGDDAYLDGRSLVFRTGDIMVFLDVEAEDDEDVADQRDTLADDLATIDLSDDEALCTAPAAAVEEAFGPVAETRIGGGGLSIGDVEIQTTSCTFVVDDETEVMVSVTEAESWDDWVDAMQSSVFTASYEASSIGEFTTFDTGQELFVDEGDQPLRIATSTPEISSEDAMALRVALAELVLAT